MLAPSLYQFFRRHIHHAFSERGLDEPGSVDYIADVLTRFAHTPALYAVRDQAGVPLERIAHMLIEWRRAQGAEGPRGRSRQALIMRHVGEYTLFMSGLFRERLQARGELNYYLDNGRTAYWQSADFEINPRRAQVFRRLYFNLDKVAGALDHVRRDRFPLSGTALDRPGPLGALWRR